MLRTLGGRSEPAADDEGSRRLHRGLEEARDVVGIVLAVAVERDHPLGAPAHAFREPAPERRPAAGSSPERDTSAPAAAARAPLSSEEPSSTTSTGP